MSRSRDTADQINRVNSSAANATAMTIDSSENVYVGKTASGFNDAGLELEGQGRARFTRDGAVSLQLNRLNTHGDMALFYIDGSSKGDIGTDSGRLKIGSTSASGLRFDGAQLIPFVGTSASDNAVDLGYSSNRFRDAYIGGGVVFGATGGSVTSKTLDDYEEGSWTPVIGGNSSTSGQSYSVQYGTYTKIGNAIHLHAYVAFTTTGTMSGSYATVQGLPFSVANNNGSYAAVNVGYYSGLGISVTSIQGYTNKNTNFAYLTMSPSAQAAISYLTPSQLGTTAALILSITYNTDS
jgi:hypothetical protein